jgi:predicted RNase H-like HicB family nuclease
MKSYLFKVVIEDDEFPDGGKAYHAYCPALKGCHTWGYTPEEAKENIKEAVEGYIEDLIAHGEPVPADVLEQKQEEIQQPLFDEKVKVQV